MAAGRRRAEKPRRTTTAPRRRAERPPRRFARPVRLVGAGALASVATIAVVWGAQAVPRESAVTRVLPEEPRIVDRAAAAAPAPSKPQPLRPAALPDQGPPRLPAASGTGRRVVFDQSSQQVWIVAASGRVQRTYPVSGSVLDNLQPGTYEVFSRSRHAVGIEDSGVMDYFVRFTRGKNAAIGFHSIPTRNGEPLQTRAQLGTPQSHGCIRQARPDAVALWEFADLGTTVVVTA